MSSRDVPVRNISAEGLRNSLRLLNYMRPYRSEYIAGILFLIGSTLASLAFPWLLGELVTAGTENRLAESINLIALLIMATLVVQSLFAYFRVRLFVNVSEKTIADLRKALFNHIIKLPLSFYEKHRVGELNSRISADISLLHDTMTFTLAEFIRQIIIISGGITLLLITSWQLTLFMLAVIPAVVLIAVVFGRFIRVFSRKVQKKVAESNTIVEESFQGIRSVKTYTSELFETERYGKKVSEAARIGMKSGRYRAAFNVFMITGIFGALVAVIWKGVTMMSVGLIDTGQLFSFVIYSGFIAGTLGGLAGVYSQVQRFIGATEELFDIMGEKQEDTDENLPPLDEKEIIRGRITINNLTFYYSTRPEQTVLQDININFPENKVIAVVGPSGAGKSTLTGLIMRLYDPVTGDIFYDGRPASEFSLSAIRRQIALVPQDIFLFGGTIGENIAYGKPGASAAEIIEAAENANALEFIEGFSEKFETVVGERGTQLSGGQRQRIAIARAILKNPAILILDEATSSLDSESERLVQEALSRLMKNRTSIVIAHRLSTVSSADSIIVLDRGRVAESGTHEELVNLDGGIYRNLYSMQFLV